MIRSRGYSDQIRLNSTKPTDFERITQISTESDRFRPSPTEFDQKESVQIRRSDSEGPGFWGFKFYLGLDISGKFLRHFHTPVKNYAVLLKPGRKIL